MSRGRTIACTVLLVSTLVPATASMAAAAPATPAAGAARAAPAAPAAGAARPAPTAAVVTGRTLHGYRVTAPSAQAAPVVVRPRGCAAFTAVPAGASTAAATFFSGGASGSVSGSARVVSFPSAAAAHAQLTARRALVSRCRVDAVDNGGRSRIVGSAKAVHAYAYPGTDEGLRTLATTVEADGDRITTADSYYRRGSYVVEVTTLALNTARGRSTPATGQQLDLIQDSIVTAALQSLGTRR